MAYLFKKRKLVPALELNSLVKCVSGGSLSFKAFALRPASVTRCQLLPSAHSQAALRALPTICVPTGAALLCVKMAENQDLTKMGCFQSHSLGFGQ